jgi:hypothetical protein
MTDRADGTAWVGEPLCMASGAGRVTWKAGPRRAVSETMAYEARKCCVCCCVREVGKISACFARVGRESRDFRARNNKQDGSDDREPNEEQHKPATPLARRPITGGICDSIMHFRRVAHILTLPWALVTPLDDSPGSALYQKRCGTSRIEKLGLHFSSQSQDLGPLHRRSLRYDRYRMRLWEL